MMTNKPEVSWLAKLHPKQVRRIRRRIAIGGKRNTGARIAKDYGISQATISNLVNGKIYRRVPMGNTVTLQTRGGGSARAEHPSAA